MSEPSERDAIAYVRALERQLERFHEPPFVLSPKDWALAEEWHRLGVPLELVVECLEAAGERRTRGRRPRRPPQLAHVQAEVEEGWAVVRQGRLPAVPVTPPAESLRAARELWQRAAERAGNATPLGSLLAELLAQLQAGADAAAIDARLDREVEHAVPVDLVRDLRTAVDAELAPFRERWEQAAFEEARARGLHARIRRRLGLPRLASAREQPGPRAAQ